MAQNQLNISRTKLFITLLLAGIVLLLLPQRHTQKLNFMFQRIFGKFLSARPADPVNFPYKPVEGELIPRREYNKLLSEYNNTHMKMLALLEDYETLSDIKRSLPKVGPGLVMAKVNYSSITAIGRELRVSPTAANKDIIKEGQYVIGDNSIIGTISSVSSNTAIVRLISDTKHNIQAGLWREGRKDPIPCQMRGTGDGKCHIGYLSQKDVDVKVGDTVFAIRKKGYLETDVVIGEVTRAKEDEDNPWLWDITVTPACDPSVLTDVVIIVMNPDVEIN